MVREILYRISYETWGRTGYYSAGELVVIKDRENRLGSGMIAADGPGFLM